MSSLFFFTFFFSLFLVLKFFSKKLMILLFLELSFLSIIMLFFLSSFSFSSHYSFFGALILLIFMVLDSVYSLCLLVMCSRNSSLESSFNLG